MTHSLSRYIATCGLTSMFFASALHTQAADNNLPAIDVSAASVTATNGVPTCAVGVSTDKVLLSAQGATDKDCDGNAPDDIALVLTKWTTTSGNLDNLTGETNAWVASEVGNATITVNFEDDSLGTVFHDDPSADVTLTVTGFKVGCKLTTSRGGGDYTRYHDASTAGNTQGLTGTLDIGVSTRTPDVDETTENDNASATWKIVVNPAGTAMKGDVTITGGARTDNQSTSSYVEVRTLDEDGDDTGSHSASVGLGFSDTISYTNSFGTDDEVVNASAALAFQSQSEWIGTKKKILSDSSRDVDQAAKTSTFAHTPDDATFTGAPGESKKSRFLVGYSMNVKGNIDTPTPCTTRARIHWKFSIPVLPTYNPPQ